MISPSRAAAFRILLKVGEGGYASDLLLRDTASLDPRDAGLAGQIVFGCLRFQASLDAHIDQHTRGRRLDAEVRIALRMGAFQILHLDRVPVHAAVNESVELVRKARKASASGFVNAVLRKIRPGTEPPSSSRAVRLSQPPWLLSRWDNQFGAETADRIATEFLREPDTWLRNPPSAQPGLVLEPATEVPGAFRVVSGDTRGLRTQDIGSQSIVPLLDLRPGLRFLDLCSAPGNKTAQALEAGVHAIACDLHWHRLRNSLADCPRVVLDASRELPFRGPFDRILIDAPCSGTGTLGRNPEIRWRLRPEDLPDLQARQKAILANAARYLAPGGLLVYSTCSLEREENQDVVAAVPAGLRVLTTHQRLPGNDPGDGFFAAVFTTAD